jgi:propionyl-CoA synthetase
VKWAEQVLGVPVVDHWWQTETGWAIAANPVGLGMLPVKHGSPTVPMPGYRRPGARRGGHEVPRGNELGNICREAAAAAGLPADAVECRRALP